MFDSKNTNEVSEEAVFESEDEGVSEGEEELSDEEMDESDGQEDSSEEALIDSEENSESESNDADNVALDSEPEAQEKPQIAEPSEPSEQKLRLIRSLRGQLNRLSAENIDGILSSCYELSLKFSRNDMKTTLTDLLLSAVVDPHIQLLDSFAQLHAAFLVAYTFRIGGTEFGAHIVQTIIQSLDRHRNDWLKKQEGDENRDGDSKVCTNLVTFLAFLYDYGLISCVLIYDIVNQSVASNLNSLDVEILLRIVRIAGHKLRSDDPSSLKEIIISLQSSLQQVGEQNLSSRARFMVEMIMDLKNNKKRQSNKFFALDSSSEKIKNVIDKIRKSHYFEPLRVALKDIREVEKRGRWWLVGASWAGKDDEANDMEEKNTTQDKKDVSQALVSAAIKQGMNNDVRKSIFIVLMSSEVCY